MFKYTCVFSTLLTTVIGLSAFALHAAAPWTAGDGTQDNPFLIGTDTALREIAAQVNQGKFNDSCFRLTADIDLNTRTDSEFTAIGTTDSAFKGSFDGNSHVISSLYINKPRSSFLGLFGCTRHAVIRNIRLDSVWVRGDGAVGGLIGYAEKSSVTNVSVTGSVNAHSGVGGLIGDALGITVTNAFATGSVTGAGNLIGGLIGRAVNRTSVTNVYATGAVAGKNDIGGLIGDVYSDVMVTNAYAKGSVTGDNDVGGLIGRSAVRTSVTNAYAAGTVSGMTKAGGLIGSAVESIVTNAYAAGRVNANSDIGGLIGEGWDITITNAYWDKNSTGQSTSAGGVPKTTAEMKASAFVRTLGLKNWRWDKNQNLNNGYPVLAWQGGVIPPEPVPPSPVVSIGDKIMVSADSFHLTTPLSRKTKLEALYAIPFPKPGKPVPQKKLSVKMVSDNEFQIKGSIRLLNQKEYRLALKNVQTHTTSKVLAADSGIWKVQKDSVLTTVAVKLKGKERSDAIIITVVPPTIDSYVILDSNYVVVSVKEAGSKPKAFFEYLEANRANVLKLKKVNLAFVPEKKWEKIGIDFNSIFPNQEIAVFKTSAKKLSKLSNRTGEFNLVLDNRNGLAAK